MHDHACACSHQISVEIQCRAGTTMQLLPKARRARAKLPADSCGRATAATFATWGIASCRSTLRAACCPHSCERDR